MDAKSFLAEPGSPKAAWWRYPPAAAGIQVNYCKRPLCANFGVPPRHEFGKLTGTVKWGSVAVPGDYIVIGKGRA